MFSKLLAAQFCLVVFPYVLCVLFHTANGETQSPCFWSKCFLSGNTGTPCPNDHTNSTSKTCFWGTGTMYQCCKIVTTTVSSESEGSSTEESESSYTTESSSMTDPDKTEENTEIQDVATETPTTPEPVNLLKCEEVKEKQYPFIVALMEQRDGKVTHFCSGSIISEWYVITTASCVADKLTSKIDASAANLNLTYFEYTEQTITVKTIHMHSDFDSNDPTRKSDIALLEMEHPFRMWSSNVHPVRIAPDATFVDQPGNAGTVVGWEIEDITNLNQSAALNKVDIPFVARSECAEIYRDLVEPFGQSKIDIKTQFCAASSQSRYECAEDYGSPVIIRKPDGNRYIVGLSVVHSSSNQVPNLYTDITFYRDYIYSVLSHQ